MRLDDIEDSTNVEDVRRKGGGGGGGAPVMGGGLGLLAIVAIVWLLGGDPMALLSQMGQQQGGGPAVEQNADPRRPLTQEEEESKRFVSRVLKTTENVWGDVFRQMGHQYEEPKLVLFHGAVNSGCGRASSAMGPFYCPADKRIYIDVAFFNTMQHELGASGDFAYAYVIAHEVGHHVQNLLGTSGKVSELRGRVPEAEYNKYSVRLELQADFYAGMWANHVHEAFGILEQGDLDEALNAALAIGDDTLQRKAQGRVVPDSFTHGTSEQRARWFKKGYTTGDIRQGDTFNARDL